MIHRALLVEAERMDSALCKLKRQLDDIEKMTASIDRALSRCQVQGQTAKDISRLHEAELKEED